jgi:nicotinate-nucleotide--dimethylbenzimidazole phosphoribosyltransferase
MREALDALVARIERLDASAMRDARAELDSKTKPRGSLGRLETLAATYAGIRGDARPAPPRAAVVVAAGDHGYADEGVSAYPQEVTRQMLANFESGGAAICVLARELGAELVVVDAGVGVPTANGAREPAMSGDRAMGAMLDGAARASSLAANGFTVVAIGEMGIGNTTAASAVHAALLGLPAEAVCGPGTGLDAEGVRRKAAVVERALARHGAANDPVGVLASLGGVEIAVLAGVTLGCAAERVAVVVDGFVATAAALVAARIAPLTSGYLIAAHRSPEPGHVHGLAALGLEPLLDLELRLGEGTGATLALPLLRSATALLRDMATFRSAGVTDAGR